MHPPDMDSKSAFVKGGEGTLITLILGCLVMISLFMSLQHVGLEGGEVALITFDMVGLVMHLSLVIRQGSIAGQHPTTNVTSDTFQVGVFDDLN